MLVAGVALLGWLLLFNRESIRMTYKTCGRILALGFFAIYLTNAAESWGLCHLTSFKTCFLYSLSPFLSAAFAYLLLRERLNKRKWVGLAVGIIGFMPLLMHQSTTEQTIGGIFIFSWPELSVLGAVVCSVYGWTILGQLVRSGVSPLVANALAMMFGGAIALLHSLFVENWNPIPVSNVLPYVGWTCLLIIASNIIAYNLYGHLLKRYSAAFLSFAGFSTPFFTAILGWVFLHETVPLPYWITAGIVFTGLTIFYSSEQLTTKNRSAPRLNNALNKTHTQA